MGKVAFILAYLASASNGRLVNTSIDHTHRRSYAGSQSRQQSQVLVKALLALSPAHAFNPSGPGVSGNPSATRSRSILPLAGTRVLVASAKRVAPAKASDSSQDMNVDREALRKALTPATVMDPPKKVVVPSNLTLGENETVNLLDIYPDLNLSIPAPSYSTLCEQAAEAVHYALEDGELLLEVEFPPFPVTKLDGDSSISADVITKQNLELALTMIKAMQRIKTRFTAITMPDQGEYRLANEKFGDSEPFPMTRTWSINSGDEDGFSFSNAFGSLFKQGEVRITPAEWTDIYVFVGFSMQEVPAIEALHELDPTKPKIFFNTKLDEKRADLGFPNYPPRSLHHEFLSKVMPVFYLRFRFYTLTLIESPWILAYQGNLFRKYPEPYQSILDKIKDKGLRVVKAETMRPNLGQFKGSLTRGLKLFDQTARNLADAKADINDNESVWWEDDDNNLDVSQKWKM